MSPVRRVVKYDIGSDSSRAGQEVERLRVDADRDEAEDVALQQRGGGDQEEHDDEPAEHEEEQAAVMVGERVVDDDLREDRDHELEAGRDERQRARP